MIRNPDAAAKCSGDDTRLALMSSSTPPSSATAAVLVPSNELPVDSQKVEELDFNAFVGRPITVDDLVSGMRHMGFQASSMGKAIEIINGMVRLLSHGASR